MTNELSAVRRDQAPVLTWEQAEPSALGQLEVNVIFTDPQATAAAFKAATTLAADLDACIRVRAAIAVPFSLPLDRPQVSVPFTEKILSELVSRTEPNDLDVRFTSTYREIGSRLFCKSCTRLRWSSLLVGSVFGLLPRAGLQSAFRLRAIEFCSSRFGAAIRCGPKWQQRKQAHIIRSWVVKCGRRTHIRLRCRRTRRL